MRLVYVDEAGISNPDQEPFLTVAGIIVHADTQLLKIENRLDELVEKYIPALRQQYFVFHAHELFNARRFFHDKEYWPLEKRLQIAAELVQIPVSFKLPVALGFVERGKSRVEGKIPKQFTRADETKAEHINAFMRCSLSVEQWMRNNASDEVCLMIVEDNDRARSGIRDTQSAFQDAALLYYLTDPEKAKKYLPIRKIREDPLFQKKRKSSVLQIADFCAYVFKRALMKDENYKPFLDPWKDQIATYTEA